MYFMPLIVPHYRMGKMSGSCVHKYKNRRSLMPKHCVFMNANCDSSLHVKIVLISFLTDLCLILQGYINKSANYSV